MLSYSLGERDILNPAHDVFLQGSKCFMSFKEITYTFENLNLSGDFLYQVNGHHRDKNPNKSQWIVSPRDEVNVFVNSYNNRWFDDHDNDITFGLKVTNNKLEVLGTTVKKKNSKVAKFSLYSNIWHGYPADVIRRISWRKRIYPRQEYCVNGVILDTYQKSNVVISFKEEVLNELQNIYRRRLLG